ncbi:MAG: large subunit ribosomal protein L25 [Rhodothermales bacterium]|jgi:large subunit ribosomal protein L25
MEVIKLAAKSRTPGKGPSRAARRALEVPCVLYGNSQEPVTLQLVELDMRPLIYTDEFHRVEITVDGGESYDCILKSLDFHPVSDRPMHADFQVLTAGQVITLTVPVQTVGLSLGQREGGTPQVYHHELEITCLPKDIPDHFVLDITDIDVGGSIQLSDLADDRFAFALPMDSTLFAIQAARLEEVEEEDELGVDTVGAAADPEEEEETE